MDILGIPGVVVDFAIFKVLPFIAVLTLVVFIHELGHFLVARWNGITVEAFSVGFGPELFGWNDSKGTRWRVAAIPLGGYVRFMGDMNASSQTDHEALRDLTPEEREGAFETKALWRRALVVAAGPIANFILAIVLYFGLFVSMEEVRVAPVVGTVTEGSPAAEAGILPGDRVTAIDGTPIEKFRDMQPITMMADGEPLTFTIQRNGAEQNIVAAPRITERKDPFGNTYRSALVGIAPDSDPANITRVRLGPVEAFEKALSRTWLVVAGTGNFIAELFGGKQDARELRGPLGIAQITSQVATLGILSLISLAAVLSVSIGLMNLLPVPMLDGGHLMFYAIEAVRGRAMSEKNQERAYRVGLAMVLAMMLFATSNDIVRSLFT
ncbi:MAG: RIP metalloprotease RseP [Pseudomonadota bacterium]